MGEWMPFGSVVLYKISSKVEGGVMGHRWGKGVWLGKRFATEEHIVADEDGKVRRSPSVRPHPTEKWSWEAFDKVIGLPWDPNGEGKEVGEGGETEKMVDIPRAFDNPTVVRVEAPPQMFGE